jgi:hypothetical protein
VHFFIKIELFLRDLRDIKKNVPIARCMGNGFPRKCENG